MDNEIDSVVAVASEQNAAETLVENPQNAEEQNTETPEQKNDGDKSDSFTFPKKAVNKINRLERKLYNERAARAAIEAELAKYTQSQSQQSPQSNKSDSAPREEDFDNYGDYLKASFKYDMQQEQAKTKAEAESQQSTYKEQLWKAEREQAIVQSFDGHKQNLPDFEQVISSFVDVADDFSPEIEKIFLSAQDPALAFYNLAKDGKLEALATTTPYQVMREVALAEMKKPEIKRISSAPQPIKGATGAATGRSENALSGAELLKKYKLK